MAKLKGQHTVGLLIVAFGIIALLNNFGLTSISLGYLINLIWPLLLAAAGIRLVANRNLSSLLTGVILIILGVVFFGRNSGMLNIDLTYFWRGFWPIIIILIGINILTKSEHNKGGSIAIMGAVDKTKEIWDLKSAEYTTLMGGIELDISKANFIEYEVNLDLNAIMGGITLIVPEEVAITGQGTAILGGIELMGKDYGGIVGHANLERGDTKTASKILNLNCTCIMGGIEIKVA